MDPGFEGRVWAPNTVFGSRLSGSSLGAKYVTKLDPSSGTKYVIKLGLKKLDLAAQKLVDKKWFGKQKNKKNNDKPKIIKSKNVVLDRNSKIPES